MPPKTLVVVSSEERLLLTALTALTALRSGSALPMRQKSVSTILSSSAGMEGRRSKMRSRSIFGEVSDQSMSALSMQQTALTVLNSAQQMCFEGFEGELEERVGEERQKVHARFDLIGVALVARDAVRQSVARIFFCK